MVKPRFSDLILFSLFILLLLLGVIYTNKLIAFNSGTGSKNVVIFIRNFPAEKHIALNNPVRNNTFTITLNSAERSKKGEAKGLLIKGKIQAKTPVLRRIVKGKFLRFHLDDKKNLLKGIILYDE